MNKNILVIIISLFFSLNLFAGTHYYISASGSDLNDGLSVGAPKLTLDSIPNAYTIVAGDTIHLAAGTYTTWGTFDGESISGAFIIGAGSDQTIFDGAEANRFGNMSVMNLTFENLKFINMQSTAVNGGVFSFSSAIGIGFKNVVFEACSTGGSFNGGVLEAMGSSEIVFKNCVFKDNYSAGNGSVFFADSEKEITFENCIFDNNHAQGQADIFYSNDGLGGNGLQINHCTFVNNKYNASAVVEILSGPMAIKNSIFYGNLSTYSIKNNSSVFTLYNCIYDTLQGSITPENCLEKTDPRFRNMAVGDFGIRYDSPAKNNGISSALPSDIEGTTRTTPDIGAYEWHCTTPSAGMASLSQDACPGNSYWLFGRGYVAQYFKWQKSSDGTAWSDVASSDTSHYHTANLGVTSYFRTAASCNNSDWDYSTTDTLTIAPDNYYMSTSGSNGNNGLSALNSFQTLQYALGVMGCADTLNIDEGTYAQDNIYIADGTKGIVIRGVSSETTIFDGTNENRFLEFSGGGNSDNITISGLTIKDMTAPEEDGSGIKIQDASNLVFEDLIFDNCIAVNDQLDGGAVYSVFETQASATFNRCVFRNNFAGNGGCIYWKSAGNVSMANCLFYENTSKFSEVINTGSGTMNLMNCTLVDNDSTDYVITLGSISTVNVTNSIVYGNISGNSLYNSAGTLNMSYCIYETAITPTTNVSGIQTAPTFYDKTLDLYAISPTSVGIDAGTNTGAPTKDIFNVTRISGGNTTVDIGAYEQANYIPPCQPTVTWTGAVSTLWSNKNNWDKYRRPCGNNVIIADVANDPTLDVIGECADFTMNGTSILNLATSDSFLISGDFDMNGTSSINYTGSGVFLLYGGQKYITTDAGVNLSSVPVTIGGVLSLNAPLSVKSLAIKTGDSISIAAGMKLHVLNDIDNDGTINIVGSSDSIVTNGFINNSGIINMNYSPNNLIVGTNLINSGTLNFGYANIKIGGDFTHTGTIDEMSSIFTFDGSENSTIEAPNGISFNDLVLNKTSVSNFLYFDDTVTVNASFTNTEGTLKSDGTENKFSVVGSTIMNGGKIEHNDNGVLSFEDLTMNGSSLLVTSSTDANDYITIGGNIDLNGTATISHTGDLDIRLTGAGKTISAEAGVTTNTVEFNVFTTADYVCNDNLSLEDLTITAAGDFAVSTTKTLTLTDDLLIGGATSIFTLNGTAALQIGGDFNNGGGTFNENLSTVIINGNGNSIITNSGGVETFNNLILNKSSVVDTVDGGMNIITVSNYTNTQGTYNINIGGLNVTAVLLINGGRLWNPGGNLTADDASVDMNGGILDIDGGIVDFDNDANGDVDFDISAGKVEFETGTMVVGDDILMSGGEIEILSGSISVSNEHLTGNGIENTGGTLDIQETGEVNTNTAYIQTGGAIEISGGNLNIGYSLDGLFSLNNGTYSFTGGVIEIMNNNAGSNEVIINGGSSQLATSGGVLKISASNGASEINVAAGQKLANLEIATTNQTVSLQSDLDMNGDVTISSGILAATSYNITTKGNWTNNSAANNASFTGGTGTVTMAGTSAKSINGTYPVKFNDFILINSNDVTLNTPLTLSGHLDLQDGKLITTWTNRLIMDDGASNNMSPFVSFSPSNYVSGPIRYVSYTAESASYGDTLKFPVGDGVHYAPVHIIPSGTGTNSYDVRYADTAATAIGANRCAGDFYMISAADRFKVDRFSGTQDAKLRMHWNANSAISDQEEMSRMILIHWNAGSSCWEALNADTSMYTRNWSEKWIETKFDVTQFIGLAFGAIQENQQCSQANFTFTDSLLNTDTLKTCASNIIQLSDSSIANPTGFGTTITEWKWEWGDGSPQTVASNGNNVTHSYLTGIYNVQLIVTNDGAFTCKDTIQKVVQVFGDPSQVLEQAMSISCDGGSNGAVAVTITNGHLPYTYMWGTTLGGGEVITNNTSIAVDTIKLLSAGKYYVSITDYNECTVSDSVTLAEPTSLLVDAGLDTVICNGDAKQMNVIVSGGTMPYSYSWGPNTNLSTTIIANPIANPSTTVKYGVIVTDVNACTTNDSILVTVKNGANVSEDSTICIGDSVLWNGNYYKATGAYSVTNTGANTCDSITTLNLTVETLSSVSLLNSGTNDSLCLGSMVNFDASGGTLFTFYLNNNIVQSGVEYQYNTDTLKQDDQVYVEVVQSKCTVNSNISQMKVLSLPSIATSSDTMLCEGQEATLEAFASNVSYLWSNGQSTSFVQEQNEGSHYVTITDAFGCTNMDSITIGFRDSINFGMSSDRIGEKICAGETLIFSTTGETNMEFSFYVNDAKEQSGPGTTFAWPSFVHNDALKMIATLGACEDSLIVNITVETVNLFMQADEDTICKNDSTNIKLSGADTYAWIYHGFIGDSINVKLNTDTIYKVQGTSSFGCTDIDSVWIVVNELPVTNLVNDAVGNTICKDSFITFTSSGGSFYDFYVNDSLIQSGQIATISSDKARNNDKVYVKVIDTNACESFTDTVEVFVEQCISECPIIVANYSAHIDGVNVTLKDSSSGPSTSYAWLINNEFSLTGDSVTFEVDSAGFYEVCLNVFDVASNCSDQICSSIEVKDTASVQTVVNCYAHFNFIKMTDSVRFLNTSLGTHNKYHWEFGDGTFSKFKHPKHLFQNPGFYEVCLGILDSSSGCTDQTCKVIEIIAEEDTIIPTCFADFTYFIDIQNRRVNFTNRSEGDISEYFWDFGDGNFSKTINPMYSFSTFDYHVVRLSTNDDSTHCQSTIEKTIGIHDTTIVRCYANFEYFIDDSNYVQFNNLSSGAFQQYYWIFGDGGLSQKRNPRHRYSAGIYSAVLNIYDPISGCHNQITKEIEIIKTEAIYCKAAFSSYPNEDGSIDFSSLAKGSFTNVSYDFGDNSSAYVADTSHSYLTRAFYDVCFKVIDTSNGCLDTYCDNILAGPVIDTTVIDCQAKFEYFPSGLQAIFRNKSLGDYKQVYWSFGDDAHSTQMDSVINHTYSEGGYYEVSLSVFDSLTACFDIYHEMVTIIDTSTSISENCFADFSYFSEENGVVKFKEETKGNIDKHYWNFGDGSTPSFGKNPAHKYKKFGYYEVCLTVFNKSGCEETYCEVIALGDLSEACWADFNYYADDNSFAKFLSTSLGNNLTYTWDFGDSVISNQVNPGHTYQVDGFYPVCLTVAHDSGCVRTKCEEVLVGSSSVDSCLFNCVWPGDANDDLEANHYDVLSIGLGYGIEGPRRDSVSEVWTAHSSLEWTSFQRTGANNMHADCNGDGVINSMDIVAIDSNFAYSHYRQYRKSRALNNLTLVFQGDVNPGELATVDVMVGEDDEDLSMYGLGFELGFQDGDIDYSSISVDWSDTWLDDAGGEKVEIDWGGNDDEEEDDLAIDDWGGNDDEEEDDLSVDDWMGNDDEEEDDLSVDDWMGSDEVDEDDLWADDAIETDTNDLWKDTWMENEDDTLLMTFDMVDEGNNLLMVSGTRLDKRNVLGSGKLATITFMVNANFSGDVLNVDVFTDGGIEANGADIEFDNAEVSVSVNPLKDLFAIEDLDLFPNPSAGKVSFYLSLNQKHDLRVIDLFGKTVYSQSDMNGGLVSLYLNDIAPGIYTIEVHGPQKMYRGKLNIIK